MKHTPGPWTLEGFLRDCDFELHSGARHFANIVDTGTGADYLANARLIAAAPDLLAACEAAEENLSPLYSADHFVMQTLRKAIALVKGNE